MTLCSSWVNEVAENAEKRSMEEGAWRERGDRLGASAPPLSLSLRSARAGFARWPVATHSIVNK